MKNFDTKLLWKGVMVRMLVALFIMVGIQHSGFSQTIVDLTGSTDAAILKDTLGGDIADGAVVHLKRGMTYDIGGVLIHKSVKIMTQPGIGDPAILELGGSSLDVPADTTLASLVFEDVEIQGDISGGYLMNFSTSGEISSFVLENVHIHDLRGVFRAKNGGIKTIGEYKVSNSIVHDIGGYGVIIMDNTEANCENAIFSNSTFYNIEQLARWRESQAISSFNISNCTFNNAPTNGYIARLEGNSAGNEIVINIDRTIFGSGPDKLLSGTATINASSSVATSDCEFGASSGFTSAPSVSGFASDSLFADAANGDFTLADNFAMNNSLGDPRWFYIPQVIDLVGMSDANALADTLDGIGNGATILLKRGMTYDLGGAIVSKSVTIKSGNGSGAPAVLEMGGSSLDVESGSAIGMLMLEDVEIKGDIGSGYLMNFSTEGSIDKFTLKNVDIHDLRGVFRAKNGGVKTIGEFKIEHSYVHSIGSYGVMIMDNVEANTENAVFMGSTFNDIYQLTRWRESQAINSIKIADCTFNNAPNGGYIARLEGNDAGNDVAIDISNTVFGLGADNLLSGSATINTTNTFATTDCAFGASTDFATAPTVLSVDAATLFADAANGDFTLSGDFEANRTAGDPMWYYTPSDIDLTNSADAAILKTTLEAGYEDGATIILARGMTYDMSSGGTPLGNAVKIMSAPGPGAPAMINMGGSSLDIVADSVLDLLMFEDVEIYGDISGGYLMNFSTSGAINNFVLENVNIHDLRGVFRAKNGGIKTIGEYKVNNSVIHDIGGYGVMIMDNTEANCENATFMNSTFYNIEQLTRWRESQAIHSFTIDNCSFNNAPTNGYIARLEGNSAGNEIVINISNTVFGAGPNKLLSGSATINAMNTYATADCEFGASSDFAMAPIALSIGSADLFKDPANGDLTLSAGFKANTSVGDPRWHYVGVRKVAYIYKTNGSLAVADGAAAQDDDPVIRLFREDPMIELTLIESDGSASIDLAGFDLAVITESFGSGDDILKPGGSLFYGDIEIPFIYNKSYALKSGKGIVEGSTGSVVEPQGLNLSIPSENQNHALFRGFNFATSDEFAIYKSLSDDHGALSGTKNLNPLYELQISTSGTNLATHADLADKAPETVLINEIPVGTSFGTATDVTLKAKMLAFAFAYGPMMKANGANMTDEGLTLWRNAIYYMSGLDVPEEPIITEIKVKEVAYFYKTNTLADGTAPQDNDPVITLLNADPNFNVTAIASNGSDPVSLDGFDMAIISESFGSGDDILKPGGSLFYGDIAIPFIYNKTYALKEGKGIVEGSTGLVAESTNLNMAIPTASQGHPIFSGIDFSTSDSLAIYKSLSDDNGTADAVTKNINPLHTMQISTAGTNLATHKVLDGQPAETVLINDIPAGTTFGTATTVPTQARMIAFAFAYGPMMKNGGKNMTDEGLTIWRNAAYTLAGLVPPNNAIKTQNVAYIQKAEFATVEGATSSTNDPIIQMLNADPNFNLSIYETTDGSELDLSNADLIIAQETFGSSDAIWKSDGALGIRNISAPVIYNKTWALRDGKAIASANAAVSATTNLTVDVAPENQMNPLFSGLAFVNDKLTLFRDLATQDGSDGVNSIDALNRLELSSKGTLLASVPEAMDPDSSIVINHIPAGTQFGTDAADVLGHDMVALSFNYGAMIKNNGTNMTDDALTIWRNAAYVLTGLTPPDYPLGNGLAPNDTTLADLLVNGETVTGFSAAQLEYDVLLPRGTTEVPTVDAFASNPSAKVTITDASGLPGTTEVLVEAPDGVSTATYVLNFEVSIYPPTWTIIPSGESIPNYFDAAAPVGDTLVLVDGGVYEFNTARTGGKEIVLMSVPNPITRPQVLSKVIEMNGAGDGLVVRGIDFGPFSTSADYFINFTNAMQDAKRVIVDDVKMEGFGRSIIRGNRAVQSCDTIIFNNVQAYFDPVNLDDQGYSMFFFDDDCDVSYFELSNSTFIGGHHYFLDMIGKYEKDVKIDHCTFEAVNATQPARALDFIRIDSSLAGSKFEFTNSIVTGLDIATDTIAIKTFAIGANVTDVIKNSAYFNNDTDNANDWSTIENYNEADPQYLDAENWDLTVQNEAFYTMGTDGGFIGDPRWNKDAASSDAFLTDLTIDGTTIEGFSIGVFDYEVLLAPGTTTIPTIDATERDTTSTVVITQATDVNGEATVTITAEDGVTVRVYTVDFIVADGPLDATLLADLTVDGTTVEGFDAKVFDYNVVLEPGTTTIPTVEATANYADGVTTVTVTQSDSTAGTASVLVESIYTYPESNTYTVNFTVAISTDATLSEILVNGEAITLEEGITSYDVGIEGTTVPTVTATPTFVAATVVITDPATAPGTTTEILVTAEDGVTTKTYLLNWVEKKGNDATLSDLKVDGATISGFDANTFSYSYEASTLEVPGIIATTSDPAAQAVVNYPSALSTEGSVDATVVVTAEDGETTNTYTISITTSYVVLGLGDLESNVYPNPFVNELNIVSREKFSNISVFNMNGQEVLKVNMASTNRYRLNVSDLGSGQYTVRIVTTTGDVKSLKVIK